MSPEERFFRRETDRVHNENASVLSHTLPLLPEDYYAAVEQLIPKAELVLAVNGCREVQAARGYTRLDTRMHRFGMAYQFFLDDGTLDYVHHEASSDMTLHGKHVTAATVNLRNSEERGGAAAITITTGKNGEQTYGLKRGNTVRALGSASVYELEEVNALAILADVATQTGIDPRHQHKLASFGAVMDSLSEAAPAITRTWTGEYMTIGQPTAEQDGDDTVKDPQVASRLKIVQKSDMVKNKEPVNTHELSVMTSMPFSVHPDGVAIAGLTLVIQDDVEAITAKLQAGLQVPKSMQMSVAERNWHLNIAMEDYHDPDTFMGVIATHLDKSLRR